MTAYSVMRRRLAKKEVKEPMLRAAERLSSSEPDVVAAVRKITGSAK